MIHIMLGAIYFSLANLLRTHNKELQTDVFKTIRKTLYHCFVSFLSDGSLRPPNIVTITFCQLFFFLLK